MNFVIAGVSTRLREFQKQCSTFLIGFIPTGDRDLTFDENGQKEVLLFINYEWREN